MEIPSERTVYRVMEDIGISHPPRRKPNGITKADREARRSEDLLKRDFKSEKSLTKCVTDITQIESMWARMKSERLYDRYDTEKMRTDELKTLIGRYFISYWNNRRICSSNGGLPPMTKRQRYYDSLKEAA